MSPMINLPELHPQLAKDCEVIGEFPLCKLLLMRDANYPWFILVPMREAVTEIYQLTDEDQQQLLRESGIIAKMLVEVFAADKINIGALGNIVPQLHVHHIARYRNDPAWPAPVWGHAKPREYSPDALAAVIAKVNTALADLLV